MSSTMHLSTYGSAGRRRSRWSESPGIGKTRLLAELAARADARGYLVLHGVGVRTRARPAVLGLRRRARRVPPGPRAAPPRRAGRRDPCRAGRGPAIARATRRASRPRGVPARPLPDPRGGARAARASSRRRSRSCSSLDDLHWADTASVELLGALLRRPPDAPVLMAAVGPALADAGPSVGALSSARAGPAALIRLEVGPLTEDEARQLLGESIDPCDGERALRGQRRQPVLPRAAGPVARSRRVAHPLRQFLLEGSTSRRRCRRSGRGARAARGRRPARARRSGGGRRSLRPRARGRRGRDGGGAWRSTPWTSC